MTDEEKHRLNELMLDMEQFDTNSNSAKMLANSNEEANDENNNLVEYNPFSVSLALGDGFTPDKNDYDRLKEIDTRLERRLSRINSCTNGSISDASRSGAYSSLTKKLSTNYTVEPDLYFGLLQAESRQIKLNDEFDENEFGDKFIREARIPREQELKLKYIDSQLERLKNGSQASNSQAGSEFESSENGNTNNSNINQIPAQLDKEQIKLLLEEYLWENRNQCVIFINYKYRIKLVNFFKNIF